MLEHLPENAHLVISSRIDPPLSAFEAARPGPDSRAQAAELGFTPEEAAAFLSGVMGLDLSAEDVAALEGGTEGWIAGSAAGGALACGTAQDVSGFIESFSGSHRDVLDFLAEEVLERQPEQCRRSCWRPRSWTT